MYNTYLVLSFQRQAMVMSHLYCAESFSSLDPMLDFSHGKNSQLLMDTELDIL